MARPQAKREINYDEKLKASMLDVRGPTEERLGKARGGAAIGGEDRGTRVYHMLDTPLDRLYGRLVRASRSENQIDRLRVEYAALSRYHRLFVESGMVGNLGAVDCNRTYSPSPFNRTFLAGSERQCDDREAYNTAKICLRHQAGIVVDNVVCHQNSLEVAGYCIGKNSKTRAMAAAQEILRDAGYRLAELWNMAGTNSGGKIRSWRK